MKAPEALDQNFMVWMKDGDQLVPYGFGVVEEVKMNSALKRAVRTFLQLVAGGGLTALVTTVAGGLAPETTAVVMAANTVVVTYVQNLLEDLGWVPGLLK